MTGCQCSWSPSSAATAAKCLHKVLLLASPPHACTRLSGRKGVQYHSMATALHPQFSAAPLHFVSRQHYMCTFTAPPQHPPFCTAIPQHQQSTCSCQRVHDFGTSVPATQQHVAAFITQQCQPAGITSINPFFGPVSNPYNTTMHTGGGVVSTLLHCCPNAALGMPFCVHPYLIWL